MNRPVSSVTTGGVPAQQPAPAAPSPAELLRPYKKDLPVWTRYNDTIPNPQCRTNWTCVEMFCNSVILALLKSPVSAFLKRESELATVIMALANHELFPAIVAYMGSYNKLTPDIPKKSAEPGGYEISMLQLNQYDADSLELLITFLKDKPGDGDPKWWQRSLLYRNGCISEVEGDNPLTPQHSSMSGVCLGPISKIILESQVQATVKD